MAKSEFMYVTYINTTPQKLWKALTTPEFQKQYWVGMQIKTDWKPGSKWEMVFPDGSIADQGEVLEFKPLKKLVLKWRNLWKAGLKEEGYSRCIMDIEPAEKAPNTSGRLGPRPRLQQEGAQCWRQSQGHERGDQYRGR